MFQLSTEIILQGSSKSSYEKGLEYFEHNRIKSIQFNQEKMSFDAAVQGERRHNVLVRFDKTGALCSVSCTCQEYENFHSHCEHIVSVLKLIQEKDSQGFFSELKFRQAAKQIFNFFQNRAILPKTNVILDPVFEYSRHPGSRNSFSALSLRIGMDKLYIVRNIKSFFESMDRNEELVFGKRFTFDPSRHTFDEENKKLLGFLRELYENEKLLETISYGYSRTSVFRDKQVYLTDSGVKRFFDIYAGKAFRARINNNAFEEMRVRTENFPVRFTLAGEGSDLMLSIDFEGSVIPLTEDGEYFFAGSNIYKVSRQQQENFKPFYMAMAYQHGRKLRFIEEDKERFVSEILPFAERAGELFIDEKVQSIIDKTPIEPEIYLDRDGENIEAEVRFVYGSRIINPFAASERTSNPTGNILLRDVEKESALMDILSETDFKVKNSRLHLSGDNNIFDFVTKLVPKLQEYASIFYSDSFRKMTVRSALSFAGRFRVNPETDMLEFSFDIDGIDRTELADILASLKSKKRYYQLKDGSILNLGANEISKISGLFESMDLEREDLEKEFIEIPRFRAPFLDLNIREAGLHQLERSHAFKEFVQNILEPEDMEFEIPKGLDGTLREYQKFGFKWLGTLSYYKLGGILADDMGLGKTIQILALLLSDKERHGPAPSLIVVPTSLIYNWCSEIEKFAPSLNTVVVSGSREERLSQQTGIAEADVVVTSYPLIRRDIEDYTSFRFRYCILDEAQHIKNPGSQNSRSVKDIKAEKRFALTGTPMENNLTELWSIFDFVLPGFLYSHSRFQQKYEIPITRDEDPQAMDDLGKLIRPFILRRLKKDVLRELPEKIEHKVVAELTDEQKAVYLAYLQQARGEIEKELAEKGYEKSQIKILSALTRLRQICCHPAVFLEDYRGESGKMLLLQEVMQDSLDSGHRILLFSQFTSMLKLIQEWMKAESIEYLYLDGSTPAEERNHLVKAFNGGLGKVFLISLKAGGTGLNLTGADTVIHYDPWWNPAVEEQATDRAYRIGQKKSVHVMKLITKGTIEEKIFKLQESKRTLIDSVIQPGESLLSKMTRDEIRELFS